VAAHCRLEGGWLNAGNVREEIGVTAGEAQESERENVSEIKS
jgi:hypothetical protein